MTTITLRTRTAMALMALAALLAATLPVSMAGTADAAEHAAQGCPPGAVPASGFSDATGPHGAAIDCLMAYGITEGRTDSHYGTQATVRRDQLATMTWRLLGLVDGYALPPAQQGAFPDVPDDSDHLNSIEVLAGIAPPIVEGFQDGTFRPRADITRGQIASMLVRAGDEIAAQHDDYAPLAAGGPSRFSDVAGSPHAGAIGRLAAAGIVQGYQDGRFGTGDPATRGQIATMVTGLLDGLVAAGAVDVPEAIAADPEDPDEPVDPTPEGTAVRGSVEQVYLYGADPNTPATLYDPSGQEVANDSLSWSLEGEGYSPGGAQTDDNGALVFRGSLDEGLLEYSGIEPGEGYSVSLVVDGEQITVDGITVLAPDQHPEQSFYDDQEIGEGLTFIETRDGTLLSVYVTLPGDAEDGPYPTLIEYSGYDVSQPPEPLEIGDVPIPDLELSLGAPTMAIGQLLDYATVAVNIRGTGCSGGAFDYFETLQALDGYDAVEAVAAQDWAANVGTTGVSYPGISQLFLASMQPPSLAAAAPAAVISDHGRDTVMPGGIFNTGFALEWAEERELDTRFPQGQAWVDELIDSDEHPAAGQCADNVQLRDQNLPLLDRIEANEHATDMWDTRAPWSFADDIDTNLFLINSWQDEQTGGRAAAILDALDLDRDDRMVRFTGTNGTHVETLGPEVLTDLIEFLELYVAERTPAFTERDDFLGGDLPRDFLPVAVGFLYSDILGEDIPPDDVTIPEDRFAGQAFEESLAAYEAEAPARIMFETGAGEGPDGFPYPAFTHRFDWGELPNIAALRGGFDEEAAIFELRGDGSLVDPNTPHDGPDSSSYTYDPDAFPDYSFETRPSNDDIWLQQPAYTWLQPPPESSLSFVTEAFEDGEVLLGSASVDLWLESDAEDTDLEVVVSEVRPDGTEMYLTTGWLRASKRALDEASSTALRPRPTFVEADEAPLTPGEAELVRVETFPFGHAIREGSQLRLTIEAPGGNRPIWRFDDVVEGGFDNRVLHDDEHDSRVVLPLVDPTVTAEIGGLPELPPCTPSDGGDQGMTAVRGQPCRAVP